MKKESFELGFDVKEGGEIPQAGRHEFQTVGAMKLKEQSPTDLKLHLGIFKFFI